MDSSTLSFLSASRCKVYISKCKRYLIVFTCLWYTPVSGSEALPSQQLLQNPLKVAQAEKTWNQEELTPLLIEAAPLLIRENWE